MNAAQILGRNNIGIADANGTATVTLTGTNKGIYLDCSDGTIIDSLIFNYKDGGTTYTVDLAASGEIYNGVEFLGARLIYATGILSNGERLPDGWFSTITVSEGQIFIYG